MTREIDTITAIATPPGRGGIGIVRVSGPAVRRITRAIAGRVPPPRRAVLCEFHDEQGEIIDTGLVLFFSAPRSFTGEDVLELHGHGGPVVLDMLQERLLALGARLARPGEFSERAFLNDRIDLAQAEAIADLIDSASRDAARSALRSLSGAFSARVHALVEQLTILRVHVEAAIDFPEEEIDFLADDKLREGFRALVDDITALTALARQGCLLREGVHVVIAGPPNAGKSSLLNRLAERETAIVSDIPGTTRDVLREYISIDGLPLHVMDTAGLRDSDDPVERIGIDRAWKEIADADRVLLMLDDTDARSDPDFATICGRPELAGKLTLLRNKIDLSGKTATLSRRDDGITEITLSAVTGDGLDLLRQHLKDCMAWSGAEAGVFTARRRHLDAIARAAARIGQGRDYLVLERAGELAAEELRLAQQALGEITGAVGSDELLGRIFSSFCIGK